MASAAPESFDVEKVRNEVSKIQIMRWLISLMV